MKALKRSFVLGFALVFVLSVFPCQSFAVSTSASASVLMDVDSGRVLYSYNADKQMGIASTTKILTALVAIQYGTLSDVVTVSQEAAYTEGSSMYLKVGEQLRLETLVYGLLLSSGNDAAVAIAQHVGGSVEAFAVLMNQMAQEIGMTNSSFANPNGLDQEGHYSTAYDMALLGAAAVNNPTLLRIASTTSITIEGHTLSNHNRLLSELDGCVGLKTGYTQACGRTLVTCVNQNGQRLVAVTLNDGNDWEDHKNLYAYGFETYPAQTLVTMGQTVAQTMLGASQTVPLVASSAFSYPAKAGETVEMTVYLDEAVALEVGVIVGRAVFTIDGVEVGQIPVRLGKSG
ncbi:D-alanyl-D-alanine carboxypeptidase family protein [Bengtsoniella intestinalis]|uniref:D-alanyl-D-alanine carboxypeptidase family protein n=1 Tax=Bengtsoniella intestinalis TaxID=3073143 RepID=UPI00391F6F8D